MKRLPFTWWLERLPGRGGSARGRSKAEGFRQLADAFPDAVLVVDDRDAIEWFNAASTQLLGLRWPEDRGHAVTNFLRDPDFANWIAIEDQVRSHLEMPSPRDGNARLRVSAVHLRDARRLLILRDVTDLHNMERIRRDFVANVSHELRTPLTVLLGYLEGMLEEHAGASDERLSRMQDQARQMQALLDDLLELSRLQHDLPAPGEEAVDVPGILSQLQIQAGELSRGRHELRFDIEPAVRLKGSAQDLQSAFRNLIHNALQYTPAGGRIHVTWAKTKEGAVLTVSDTGIGIPRRDIPRLTERFYRVGTGRSRHLGGTGLGLSIVKHVLIAHQARLAVESELGEGSRFRCEFGPARVISPQADAIRPRLGQDAGTRG